MPVDTPEEEEEEEEAEKQPGTFSTSKSERLSRLSDIFWNRRLYVKCQQGLLIIIEFSLTS